MDATARQWWGVAPPALMAEPPLPLPPPWTGLLCADATADARTLRDIQVDALPPPSPAQDTYAAALATPGYESFTVPGHDDMQIRCVNLVYSYSAETAVHARLLLSLRQMQRSWLALGYRRTRTKGSNAIGIKYASPWMGAHFVNCMRK